MKLRVCLSLLFFSIFSSASFCSADPVTITINADQAEAPMRKTQLGVGMTTLVRHSGLSEYLPKLAKAGIGLLRYPGGGQSDLFHWKTNTFSSCSYFYAPPETAFDTWMNTIGKPSHAKIAVTVNYGANQDCTRRGNPKEAADWVYYANKVKKYGIKYWTVGNERYFPLPVKEGWTSPDPYDPAAYAKAVAEKFYPMMKAQDPTIKVGIDMALGNGDSASWDPVVLTNAKYDFVDLHYYPNYNNMSSDTADLTSNIDQFVNNIAAARTLLANSGHADAEIFLSEFDRDSGGSYNGHELVSIVDALFNAMIVAELIKADVPLAAAHVGVDNCTADPAPGVAAYGWQDFGSYGLFAAGDTGPYACPTYGAPEGTVFPKGRAFELLAKYVTAGEHTINVSSSVPAVRAYGATQGGGYAFLLVNTSKSASYQSQMVLNNGVAASYSAERFVYGKSQYDNSKNGVWSGAIHRSMGTVTTPFAVTLPPWSITVVQLKPVG